MNHFDRNLLNLTATTLLGALAAATAVAAPVAAKAPLSFKDCDANGDGAVSLDEFRALGGQERAFREGDANRDDRLDAEEFVKARAYNDRITSGGYAGDTVIAAKVKALLRSDDGTRGAAVKVQAHKGMVLLSGWVNDASQIAEAEKLARSVEGVQLVSNDLRVRR